MTAYPMRFFRHITAEVSHARACYLLMGQCGCGWYRRHK